MLISEHPPPSPPLGAHTSIAGGVFKAIENGLEIKANVVQIFSKNQMQWQGRPYTEAELEKYFQWIKATGVQPVVIHDAYLINLASPEAEIRQKSVAAFVDEMQRAATLKIPYLLTHPGSHKGAGESTGVQQVARSLRQAWEIAGTNELEILLEATAGQGNTLGHTFEQLRDMIALSGIEEHIGVCIDTCHIFAAGYDLRTPDAWEQTREKFDRIIGLNKLKLFHLNDSRFPLNSRKDRHQRIGQGEISRAGFAAIVNDPQVNHLPMILEVPGGLKAFGEDLVLLRSLVKKTKKLNGKSI